MSVVFILDKRMEHLSTEEKAQNPDMWEAINGVNPYILPFKYRNWDCNWKCMQCRMLFDHLDEHWQDFHSDNGPKKQSFSYIGTTKIGTINAIICTSAVPTTV